jgi:hypothetical protein
LGLLQTGYRGVLSIKFGIEKVYKSQFLQNLAVFSSASETEPISKIFCNNP